MIPKKYSKILKNYTWPGNFRQLQHVIERFILLSDITNGVDSFIIDFLDDSFDVFDGSNSAAIDIPETTLDLDNTSQTHRSIKEHEREHILKVLEKTNFNLSQAALLLNISRSTLYRKLKDLNLR